MIKAVIFDCFGVLYNGSIQTLMSMATSQTAREIRDLHRAKDYNYLSYEEFIDQVSEALGRDSSEILDIINKKQLPNEQLIDYARRLRARVKVGFLSNIDEHTYKGLFDGKTRDIFDAVVLSYEEGVSKPEAAIYELAASRLGVKMEECVMVDDLPNNCTGADLVGMKSILHTDNIGTIARIEEALQNARIT